MQRSRVTREFWKMHLTKKSDQALSNPFFDGFRREKKLTCIFMAHVTLIMGHVRLQSNHRLAMLLVTLVFWIDSRCVRQTKSNKIPIIYVHADFPLLLHPWPTLINKNLKIIFVYENKVWLVQAADFELELLFKYWELFSYQDFREVNSNVVSVRYSTPTLEGKLEKFP